MTDELAIARAFRARHTQPRTPVALAAETWARAPFSHHRAAILRYLRIGADERTAHFATAPFRILQEDGRPWIAGAIGCPAHLDLDSLREWIPADIAHVILWNPKTGELRLMGEAATQPTLIVPAADPVTVYADGYSFFRAWAEARAEQAIRCLAVNGRAWTRHMTEPADSLIPGALAIGAFDQLRWTDIEAETVFPGPGVDPDELRKAIWRAHRVPRVVGGPALRKVA